MTNKSLIESGWKVAGIRSASKFFSALPELLPKPVNLCFEGIAIAVKEFTAAAR